jgi:nucleoside-diphosphate-sugar epimerase
MKDAEYVVHVAGVTRAKDRRDFFEGNVTTTRNLLEVASRTSGIKKFCFVSSLTAVGPSSNGAPLDEQALCQPGTSYAVSKLQAETLCQLYSQRVPIVIIRPPAVYGPRDRDVLELFQWVGRGITPILGSKQKTLSLIYATDLARAIVDATISEKTVGETYFATDETIYSQIQLIHLVAELMDKRAMPLPAPPFLVYSVAAVSEFFSLFSSKPPLLTIEKARDLLQTHWVCSSKKIEEHIGFKCIVPAAEGLKATLEWYRHRGWL